MRNRLGAIVLAGATLAAPRLVAAEAPAPNTAAAAGDTRGFQSERAIDGRSFALTGAGAHESDGEKQYDMALYVDAEDARRAFPALAARAGGRTRARLLSSDHAQSFIVWGHFTKVALLRAAKPLTAEALRAPIKACFDEELQKASAGLQKKAAELVALFPRDLDAGDELELRTYDDGRIELELDGETHAGPQSPKLVRALWDTWLGPKAPVKDLTRPLVDRIDVLGK